eukprot:CAMPEP_0174900088 /NCGR_PEP_ID=MMETSP0167-20121228/29794_1 /TAXON_ID=38298 /ORGANISM="Rhodella maculata, Strain CCMP736" /LENGTH=238 /DNA_ID=CAMNT_0016141321 /DNA_START=478 /DNA_END=1195 /DNA_ORIENTATION=-
MDIQPPTSPPSDRTPHALLALWLSSDAPLSPVSPPTPDAQALLEAPLLVDFPSHWPHWAHFHPAPFRRLFASEPYDTASWSSLPHPPREGPALIPGAVLLRPSCEAPRLLCEEQLRHARSEEQVHHAGSGEELHRALPDTLLRAADGTLLQALDGQDATVDESWGVEGVEASGRGIYKGIWMPHVADCVAQPVQTRVLELLTRGSFHRGVSRKLVQLHVTRRAGPPSEAFIALRMASA